jgi:hypothetical protein
MPPPDVSSFVPPLPPLVAVGGAPLYVTGEDALRCTVFNALAGVTVTITGRMLVFGQARPSPFTQTLIPATDRSASTVTFSLGDGWLLNAQVIVSVGTPAIGQTFARLSIVHGLTSVAAELFTLCADYITARMPLSYPGSSVQDSTEGQGALRSITGTTPAAGAEIAETVPTGARWELLAFFYQLVTAVAVANRTPNLILDDGANIFFRIAANAAQVASTTLQHSYFQGVNRAGLDVGVTNQLPIPSNNRLGAGFRLRTLTAAIQAADQFSLVQYLVREWIEGA